MPTMPNASLKRQRDHINAEGDEGAQIKRRCQKNRDPVKLSQLYNDLAAESEETRLNAAQQFILEFAPENEHSNEDIKKAIVRLVRGLCSARKAARLGFFVTLTELLRQIFGQQESQHHGLDLTIDGLVDLFEENTRVEKNASGKEKRDQIIGKLSAYKALLQSGLLQGRESHLETWSRLLDRVYGLARDIPWLREECGQVVVEAVKSLETNLYLKPFARQIIQKLVSFNIAHTPEGVAVWLSLVHSFEDILPTDIWDKRDPLSKKERARLARVLKEDFRQTQDKESNETVKSGATNPNPNFAWDVVLSEILHRDESRKDSSSNPEFPQFWIDIVDSSLFASAASHERKLWGFKLFAKLIAVIPDPIIASLFGPNLIRSLVNQSKNEATYLHEAALTALKALRVRVEKQASSAAPIFIALTSKHATSVLDYGKMPVSKTLEQIVQIAEDDSLRRIVRHLSSLIVRPETKDQNMADIRRQKIADLLLYTVKDYKRYDNNNFLETRDHDNWLQRVLEVLVEHAYFNPTQAAKTKKIPLPPISEPTRKIFRERLSSCLTRLCDVKTESPASCAVLVLSMIQSEATNKTKELIFSAEKPIIDTLEGAMKTMEELTSKTSSPSKTPAAQGFVLLYSLASLQVYNGDTDAVLLLDDLDAAYKPMLKNKKGAAPHGQGAFIEILLTFLGHSRSLFHKIAQEAFKIFAADMSSDALRTLTDILDTPENLDGQRELFEQGDEGGDDEVTSEDDTVEEVDVSDVEMINGEPTDSKDHDGDVGSASGSEHSSVEVSSAGGDSSGDEDDEELAAFDTLLAQTLQTSKMSLNGAEPDESTVESDMDDEQMMALDPHLSKIFQDRSKLSSKKQQAEAKQTVVQFKSRVLDLLSLFMEKQYSDPLSFEILLPVIRRLRPGANKQVTEKSHQLLKAYFDTRRHHKAPLPKPDDLEPIWSLLVDIHEEAKMGGGSGIHATACANASLHLVKAVVAIDRLNYAKALEIYSKTQAEWFTDKASGIQPVLFQQLQNWSMQARK